MDLVKKILKPIASLRLTVVLLAIGILVVFAGTLAQRTAGIETVKKQYFHTWFTWIEFQNLLPFVKMEVPGKFPMLGGWALIVLMLVNLLAAHALRFKPTWRDLLLVPPLAGSLWFLWMWQNSPSPLLLIGSITISVAFLAGLVALHMKRAGVILLHLGLIFLLLGELVTSVYQEESMMQIHEGSYSSYSEDARSVELALIDKSPAGHDDVIVVPGSRLRHVGRTVSDPKLPVEVETLTWFPNSDLAALDSQAEGTPKATAGHGLKTGVVRRNPVAGVGDEASKVDYPAAYVTFKRAGQPVGTYLVSAGLKAQELTVDGKTYELSLRFKRDYKPFQIHLKDFTFKRYVGTEVAKDYASVVRLVDPAKHVDREVRIWMNHPLRYNGETYFQSSFGQDERSTILQVVRNPGWLMPYFSCAVVSLGLLGHFVLMLVTFLMRQLGGSTANPRANIARPGDERLPPPLPGGGRRKGGRAVAVPNASSYTLEPNPLRVLGNVVFPLVMVLLTLVVVGRLAQTPKYIAENVGKPDKFDFDAFARLPISHEGRPMPMEAFARDLLKVAAESESIYTYDKPWPTEQAERGKGVERTATKRPQVQFLLDMLTGAEGRTNYEFLRIKNPELLGMLKLDERQRRYSINQLMPHGDELQKQIHQVAAKRREDKDSLNLYERDLLEAANHMERSARLAEWTDLLIVPPAPGSGAWDEHWTTIIDTARASQASRVGGGPAAEAHGDRYAQSFYKALAAYKSNDPAGFNRAVAEYRTALDRDWPDHASKLDVEVAFRRFEAFHMMRYVYGLVFVLAALSWIGWSVPLRRAALGVLVVTFLVHTAAMAARFYITGRPPVTTLYTSAVFIGWGAIIAAVFMELLTRKAVGTAAAAVIGFVTLLIAEHLYMAEGDTMRQLQAVLDTNFWLWTHVQTVTYGYAATFLAALFGIVFVIGGVFARGFDPDARKLVAKAVYGTVCFAMLLSFIGTTLGGIWADQSWGRFWGWDPKENGAILIVLWNAIILHARWAGLVRERGVATLAVVGAIITSWSWFGTNMLGVGLHSYGFMESGVKWLTISAAALLAIVALGCLPTRMWKSYNAGRPA